MRVRGALGRRPSSTKDVQRLIVGGLDGGAGASARGRARRLRVTGGAESNYKNSAISRARRPRAGPLPRRVNHQDPCPDRHRDLPGARCCSPPGRQGTTRSCCRWSTAISVPSRAADGARDVRLLADKAYSHPSTRTALRRRGIKHTIPERDDQIARRKAKGSAGGRPPAFDAAIYKQRNTVERGFNRLKQWRGIATRYDKYAV